MRQTTEGDPGKFRNTILMAIMQFENGNLNFFFRGPRELKCCVGAGYYSVKRLVHLRVGDSQKYVHLVPLPVTQYRLVS